MCSGRVLGSISFAPAPRGVDKWMGFDFVDGGMEGEGRGEGV